MSNNVISPSISVPQISRNLDKTPLGLASFCKNAPVRIPTQMPIVARNANATLMDTPSASQSDQKIPGKCKGETQRGHSSIRETQRGHSSIRGPPHNESKGS